MRKPANDNRLRAQGVSRVCDDDRAVLVNFSRPLTDDELRFFGGVCERTAPIMDGVDS